MSEILLLSPPWDGGACRKCFSAELKFETDEFTAPEFLIL